MDHSSLLGQRTKHFLAGKQLGNEIMLLEEDETGDFLALRKQRVNWLSALVHICNYGRLKLIETDHNIFQLWSVLCKKIDVL